MRRGEVWLATLAPPAGPRPVVLVSRQESYQRRREVVVAPVTRTSRPIRSHVSVGPAEGLRVESVINADNLQTIQKSRLRRRLTQLSDDKIAQVDEAIRFALGLPEFSQT